MTTPTPEHRSSPVLVLAPTGKTGRRVAARLRDAGVPVRARSRSTRPPFDWTDPATWDDALRGARAAYVAYSPDLVVPGAVATVRAFAERAAALGTDRVVLLSGRGEQAARDAEQAVRAVLPGLTVLRAAWFVQNVTEGDFAPLVEEGAVRLPVGATPEPFVDCDDVADVAVAALLDDGHAGRTYEVTGPRALGFAQLVAEAGAALGHPVSFTSVTPGQARAEWEAAGVPPEGVALLLELFGTLFDGRNSRPGDGVERALGRPARDVRDHLAAAARGVPAAS